MGLQFNRAVELRIYTLVGIYTIRDLQFEFDVELNRDSTPNIARILIHNLSEKTRGYVEQANLGIELYAGYNPNELPIIPPFFLPLIFKGTTINVSNYQVGTDWITDITAGDGNKEFLESYFQRSYKKGTPVVQIITELAATFFLPFKVDYVGPDVIARGRSFSGKVKDILDKLADDYYLYWSFQDQVLEVVNVGSPPLTSPDVVLLGPDTGLLDRPKLVERPVAQKKKKIDKTKVRNKPIKVGVQTKALLNGKIKPNRLFTILPAIPISNLGIEALKRKGEIKLPSAAAVYIADKVRHVGSRFGQTYETQIEGDIIAV